MSSHFKENFIDMASYIYSNARMPASMHRFTVGDDLKVPEIWATQLVALPLVLGRTILLVRQQGHTSDWFVTDHNLL